MSSLQVSNLHFESTANNRIQYTTANTINIVAGSTDMLVINTSSVTVNATITATDFNSVSDISLKDNILTLTDTDSVLSKINPVSFEWKDSKTKSYGVIAQEIESILPQLVITNDKGIKSVSYVQLIAFLIAAVKDLQKEVKSLKDK